MSRWRLAAWLPGPGWPWHGAVSHGAVSHGAATPRYLARCRSVPAAVAGAAQDHYAAWPGLCCSGERASFVPLRRGRSLAAPRELCGTSKRGQAGSAALQPWAEDNRGHHSREARR